MPDSGDRGEQEPPSLRRIQTYVPGFKGYSHTDDMRDADRMLRMRMSQMITMARRLIEEARASLEEADLLTEREPVDSTLNALKRIATEIGYTDSGYSWSSSGGEITGEDVDRLYEHDAELLDQIATLLTVVSDLKDAATSYDISSFDKNTGDIITRLAFIEDLFRKRLQILSRSGL